MGEQLEQDRSHSHDDGRADDGEKVGLFGPPGLSGPVIVPNDGLGANGNADDDTGDDLIDFHGNAQRCHRDFRAILGNGAVFN